MKNVMYDMVYDTGDAKQTLATQPRPIYGHLERADIRHKQAQLFSQAAQKKQHFFVLFIVIAIAESS